MPGRDFIRAVANFGGNKNPVNRLLGGQKVLETGGLKGKEVFGVKAGVEASERGG